MNGERFLDYVRFLLASELCPGDVVVMDNVRFHKVAGVEEAIKARGASVLYLPPYSPDFSPIEFAWRKIKADLRDVGARTADVLLTAIEVAMQAVTTRDAEKFYAHCGYPTTEQGQ